jgi:hypothetical protein
LITLKVVGQQSLLLQQSKNGQRVLVDAIISGDTDGAAVIASGNTRKVIIKMCGFADTGDGKLIGPDGNEMDTESFLSVLIIYTGAGLTGCTSPCTVGQQELHYYLEL